VVGRYFKCHGHGGQGETPDILFPEGEQDTAQKHGQVGNGMGLGVMAYPQDDDEIG